MAARTRFINGQTNYEFWRDLQDDNKETEKKKAIMAKYMPRIQAGEKLTIDEECELLSCVVLTELEGKLLGFHSISTSVLMNHFCQCRAKDPDMICHDCYAANSANAYTGLCQKIEINYIILNAYVFSLEAWSRYNFIFEWSLKAGRIESHGDVATTTCARNYLRLIKTHDFITFGVWTKNLNIYYNAFKLEHGKPGNMVFIASSPYKNKIIDIPVKVLPFVDHTFTVYTLQYAMEHHIIITCGGRSCAKCMRCYTVGNTEFHIAELEKSDARKAAKVGFDIGA